MENVRVKRFERELATEVKKRQQLLAGHRKTSQIASRQLAECENFHQRLQSKVAAMSAKWKK